LAVAGGCFFEKPPADRKPAVLDVLPGLGDPQRLVLLGLLVLHEGLADRRPQLADLRQVAAQLFGLVAVEQGRLKPPGRQALLTPVNQGPGQPADETLPVMMLANILRLGDLERLIEPAVRQRTFRLSDSQDQHGETSSSIIDD